MPICAYCLQEKNPLTREHLFPKGIDSLLFENEPDTHFFLEKSPSKYVKGDLTVKDVCRECNNGPLSELDAYARGLFSRCCNKYLSQGEEGIIEYDYDLLLRWLLKMCYNSGRVHEADVTELEQYRSYILQGSPRPKRGAIFLRTIHSYIPTGEEEKHLASKEAQNGPLNHEYFRSSIIRFGTSVPGEKVGRVIFFKSFGFVVLLLNPKASHRDFTLFLSDFRRLVPKAYLLNPDRNFQKFLANDLDTLQALEGHVLLQAQPYQELWKRFNNKP